MSKEHKYGVCVNSVTPTPECGPSLKHLNRTYRRSWPPDRRPPLGNEAGEEPRGPRLEVEVQTSFDRMARGRDRQIDGT